MGLPPGRKKWWRIWKNYGLLKQDYEDMLELQDHSCKICGEPIDDTTARVDHCHDTGEVRGLLCNKCNRGIGLLGDSITTLFRAIKYLITKGRMK